ncbi:hypothetical protein IAF33_19280, partial [Acinetobacter baumannii]|nr:hypothetical protein [Acinetobacter baumannii]
NLQNKTKLKIAASYFSIYAYAALKKELENIEELQFVFTSPTFDFGENRVSKPCIS